MPLVRHSSKIKTICFSPIYDVRKDDEIYLPTETIQQLHKERQKLKNACKLTIYLPESHYLHMKSQSMASSFGLVQIKRVTMYTTKHPFFVFYVADSSFIFNTKIL